MFETTVATHRMVKTLCRNGLQEDPVCLGLSVAAFTCPGSLVSPSGMRAPLKVKAEQPAHHIVRACTHACGLWMRVYASFCSGLTVAFVGSGPKMCGMQWLLTHPTFTA